MRQCRIAFKITVFAESSAETRRYEYARFALAVDCGQVLIVFHAGDRTVALSRQYISIQRIGALPIIISQQSRRIRNIVTYEQLPNIIYFLIIYVDVRRDRFQRHEPKRTRRDINAILKDGTSFKCCASINLCGKRMQNICIY